MNIERVLSTWNDLNAAVVTLGEEDCERLLGVEKETRRRKMFLLRIHSRINRLRSKRERVELTRLAEGRV